MPIQLRLHSIQVHSLNRQLHPFSIYDEYIEHCFLRGKDLNEIQLQQCVCVCTMQTDQMHSMRCSQVVAGWCERERAGLI